MPKASEQRKILVVSDSLHTLPDAMALLEASPHLVGIVPSLKRLQDIAPDETQVHPAEADAIIAGRIVPIDRDAIGLCRRARILALHTSGTDHVDLHAATEHGLLVTNVKGINAEQCADFAVGLIFASVRQIVRGDKAIRAGKWASETPQTDDVTGSTVGIIGLGHIGRALARRMAGFDTELLVHTRTHDPEFARRHGIRYVSLEELLEHSDIVALTASLTPETRHMIGAEELRRMKRTAHFVNIARGEMVDEDALFRALSEGWIAAAGIDVFETEPLYQSPLFALDNVVVTPHQAGLTRSGMVRAAVRATENALAELNGRPVQNVVNPEARAARGTFQ